jgi:osmotically inducible protein OsmC
MPIRSASAIWEGDLKNGRGTMRTATGSFEGPYSFSSRFEEGRGDNPEELIGAAHAGCFSMALSGNLAKAGYPPRQVKTTARVHLDKVGGGFKITTIELNNETEAPGLSQEEFQTAAEDARKNCPVSQALTSVEVKLKAVLK